MAALHTVNNADRETALIERESNHQVHEWLCLQVNVDVFR
jgi:hypothetical protein